MKFFYALYSKISNTPFKTIAGAAFVLAFFGILSRVLGLIRDRILASQFGAGDILDVYYASFRIPDLLYSLLVLGALSAAFIPVFAEVSTKKSQEDAWKLASGVLFLLVGGIIALSLFFILTTPVFVNLLAPGFDVPKQDLTETFTRIMFLSPIFLGASAIFGGILVAKRCFWAYSFAPLFYNIGIIIGATIFVDYVGTAGLAWGVAFGALLHLIVQYAAVKQVGFHFVKTQFQVWRDQYIRRIIVLMIPRTLTVAINQINLLVITIFASVLASGSLAVFNLANNLQSIPLALFGVSFAVAAFPKLSSLAAEKNTEEFIRSFAKTLRRILFFVVPASILLIVLRAQTVRVVLGAGEFDWEDTILTAQVLGILALSLFAQSLLPLLARAFYSLQNTKTPFYIALVSEIVNIILILTLIDPWGIYGLAVAFSVAAIVNAMLLLIFLKKKIGHIENGITQSSITKIIVASLFAGLVAQVVKSFWGNVTDLDTFVEVFVQLVAAGAAGIGAYFLASYYLRIKEFHEFKQKLLERMFGPRTFVEPEQKELDKM